MKVIIKYDILRGTVEAGLRYSEVVTDLSLSEGFLRVQN